jgi:hypothetical protein
MHGAPRQPGGGCWEQIRHAQKHAKQTGAQDERGLHAAEVHHRLTRGAPGRLIDCSARCYALPSSRLSSASLSGRVARHRSPSLLSFFRSRPNGPHTPRRLRLVMTSHFHCPVPLPYALRGTDGKRLHLAFESDGAAAAAFRLSRGRLGLRLAAGDAGPPPTKNLAARRQRPLHRSLD